MTERASLWLVCEVVEDSPGLTLDELCRSGDTNADLVRALVADGLLEPAGAAPEQWRFGGASLRITRRASRLVRDLGLNVAAAALVIELLDRIEALERQQERQQERHERRQR